MPRATRMPCGLMMLASLARSLDNDPSDPPPLLFFIHIPKTAGTTLRTVLAMNEPGRRTRALGNVFKGGGGTSKSILRRFHNKQQNLRGVRLVRGHVPLGVREYIEPHLPEGRELKCFTFLREPTDRTLSHYFAIRTRGRPYELQPLGPDSTLDDAIAGGYIYDNLQTRILSGLPQPFGEVDDGMLERAKHNLREGLEFFGITERFDESLVLAKQRLGLRSILYRSNSRVNTSRPRGDDIPAELRRSAEHHNRYDTQLYDYACELFDRGQERSHPDFEIELAALREARRADEADIESPPIPDLDREQIWSMLLDARAQLLQVEFDYRRRARPSVPTGLAGEPDTSGEETDEDSETDALKAEKTRTEELEVALQETAKQLATALSRNGRLEKKLKRRRGGVPAGSSRRRRQNRDGDLS